MASSKKLQRLTKLIASLEIGMSAFNREFPIHYVRYYGYVWRPKD